MPAWESLNENQKRVYARQMEVYAGYSENADWNIGRIDGVEQQPMHGTSFTYSFADGSAPERHGQQYFEILGNRGMYKDGWWLAWMMPRTPWKVDPETIRGFAPGVWDPASDPAELYYLPDDFSQAKNLAGQHPEKVKELQELFWQEAEKYHVLPLLGGLTTFFGMTPPLPTQSQFTYYGDVQNVASGMIPKIFNHSYTISAELEIPEGGAEGVIVAEADHLGGFSLFVQDGKLKHTYSFVGVFEFKQESDAAAGAVAGKFAKHRLESGIAEKMDAALPPGAGGVIAVYDTEGADAVDKALPNAVKKSVAHIDGTSAKKLKAGLADAQAGMGG